MLSCSAGYASWLFRLGWLAGWLAMLAGISGIYGWIYRLAIFAMLDIRLCWLFCLAACADYDVCYDVWLNILDRLDGWL
jgi:hypothetical protein